MCFYAEGLDAAWKSVATEAWLSSQEGAWRAWRCSKVACPYLDAAGDLGVVQQTHGAAELGAERGDAGAPEAKHLHFHGSITGRRLRPSAGRQEEREELM